MEAQSIKVDQSSFMLMWISGIAVFLLSVDIIGLIAGIAGWSPLR